MKNILYFLLVAVCSMLLVSAVHATAPASLTLSNTTGDGVRVGVTGEINSNIQLSFLPPGASSVTTIAFGSTDSSGNFVTSISSGGYGIPSGSPVFVTISGMQSATMLWPTYTSSLTLTKTSVQVAVGQSVTVGGSSSLILSANSLGTSIATSVASSQITITGIRTASGTVTVCGANAGCGVISVDVGGEGQTQISFSQSNVAVQVGKSISVTIMGGGHNGYTVTANSNTTSLYTSISAASSTLWLFGNSTPGTATVTVCSTESITNCSNLSVTILNEFSDVLSFSPNNIVLIPGLTQSSTVSGGPNNSYYVSSNSNSGVAQATASGNIVTLVGGSTVGSTVITVCSTSISNTCGSLRVTLTNDSTSPSSTVLVFSQNIVSVAKGDTSNVTVTGGNNTGYVISSNSNSGAVTASVSGTSNVVTLYGNDTGTSIVSVCSASGNSVCSSLYVTVGAALPAITFSQNNISLTPGAKSMVAISGGSTSNTIYSNSKPNVASASLASSGSVILLTGGSVAGSTVITICPAATYSSQCAILDVSVHINTTTTPATPASPSGVTLYRAAGDNRVYVIKSGKKQWIKTEAEFNSAGYKWSDIVVTTSAVLNSYPDASVVVKVKIINTSTLNVRKSNTTKSNIVASVNKNEVFTVLEKNSGWYKIKTSSGVTGWISGSYAKEQ